MPRRPRAATGDTLYHVLNRAVGRMTLFESDGDYAAFLRTLDEVQTRLPTRLLAYCLMPNHWHLVLWPAADGQLSEFMRLLTVTHTQRWHAAHKTSGTGPLYQGRFKSFPVEEGGHLLQVCRYVERNPKRARLTRSAATWPWSSLHARETNTRPLSPPWLLPTRQWPARVPRTWAADVDLPQDPAEEKALQLSITRGRPFGSPAWTTQSAARLGT